MTPAFRSKRGTHTLKLCIPFHRSAAAHVASRPVSDQSPRPLSNGTESAQHFAEGYFSLQGATCISPTFRAEMQRQGKWSALLEQAALNPEVAQGDVENINKVKCVVAPRLRGFWNFCLFN